MQALEVRELILCCTEWRGIPALLVLPGQICSAVHIPRAANHLGTITNPVQFEEIIHREMACSPADIQSNGESITSTTKYHISEVQVKALLSWMIKSLLV